MIYSLTLNGNPMGPIKAPHSPNSHLKSAGADPVLGRQMHSGEGGIAELPLARLPTSCPLTPSTLQTVPSVLSLVGAASFSKLWGRKAGGLAFQVKKGQGLDYSGSVIGQEREPTMEAKSGFQFSSREKCARDRIIFQCAGPK